MNKNLFRRVFNQRLGMLVAVPESAVSCGKHAGESSGEGMARGVVSLLSAIGLAVLALSGEAVYAQALPTNGQVVAGQAAISQSGNAMSIDQGTQRAVIDWNTFDIGQGNSVQFNQPNAQAQALNRVTGGVPSSIHGALLANGQVLIQNANGVLFGKNAVVNVGGLLATTKSIDTNAFMAGDPLVLKSTGTQAGVINEGNIQAAGYVTLMGDTVRNSGRIGTSPGGQVILAAGDSATVALANGQGVTLVLDGATAGALVENTGHILSQDGTVLVTARGKDALLDTVVNLDGFVRADRIVADAGTTGDVVVTGTLDASNMAAGGSGGTVVLSGDRVGVFGDARIDVSGDAAGGTAVIGGDSLNRLSGTEVEALLQDGASFANLTQVDAGATILANAVHGDGGFVETSGHDLDVQGTVSASSEHGKAGAWLIDPTNITISTGNDAGYAGSVTDGFNAGNNATATVRNTSINNALDTGTDVTITTASAAKGTGHITQLAGADITKTSGGAANLTMVANGSITLNGNITSTSDKLNLNLTAGAGTNRGYVKSNAGTRIDLNGGEIQAHGDLSKGNGANGYTHATVFHGNLDNIGGGSITGVSNALGVYLQNLTVVGDGTLNIDGNSLISNGVTFADGTITVKDTARLLVNGNGNNSGWGIRRGAGSNLNVQDQASAELSGWSRDRNGVQIDGSKTTVSDSASLNITGRSGGGYGIEDTGTLTVKDNAKLNLVGESNRTGIRQRIGNLFASGNSAVSIAGKGLGLLGIQQTSSYTDYLSDNAQLTMTGSSRDYSGMQGIWIRASGNSTANLYAESVMDDALRGSIALTGNAKVSMTGVSDRKSGVFLSGTVAGNSTLLINGQSNTGVGVDSGYSSVRISGNASVDITGTSNKNSGIRLYKGFETLDGAKLSLTGTSTDGAGVLVGPENSLNISHDGEISIYGTSVNGSGVAINGNFAANVDHDGKLVVSGESQEGAGISQSGSLSITGTGESSFDGKSVNGTGVNLTDNVAVEVGDQGSFSIAGTSTTGDGVAQGGTMNINGSGAIGIDGSSVDGAGVKLTGNGTIGITDSGVIDISGTSDTGSGVTHSGKIDVTGAGQVGIDGQSGSGDGVQLTDGGAIDVTGTGGLNIAGTSDEGSGVSQGGAINLSGEGGGSITGTSNTGTGVAQTDTGSIDVGEGGKVAIDGKSTEGTGVDQGGAINIADQGGGSINGTSTNGTGVAQTDTGSINVGGGGGLEVAGTSIDGTGVDQGGAITIADQGGGAINGTSTNGTGMAQTGDIDVGGTGSVSLTGDSTHGSGIEQGGGIRIADGGSGSLDGSSVNGAGIRQGDTGQVDIGGTGAVSMTGDSINGSGVEQGGSFRIADGGSGAIEGSSINGMGVDQTPTGVVDIAAGASGQLTGKSVRGKAVSDDMRVTGDGQLVVEDRSIGALFDGRGAVTAWAAGEASAISDDEDASKLTSETALAADPVAELESSEPAPLVVEAGNAEDWRDAMVAGVSVDTQGETVDIELKSHPDAQNRTLAYRDTTDGVAHYAFVDEATGTAAEIGIDMQTRAFVYTESGVKAGENYQVTSHGSLHAARSTASEVPAA